MGDNMPGKDVKSLIDILYQPPYLLDTYSESWFGLCRKVLCCDKRTFTQFYEILNLDQTALQYLLYRIPQLLLLSKTRTEKLHEIDLMSRLMEHLPYDALHQIITNIRYPNRATYMFNTELDHEPFVKLYINHVDDLYKLLSIRDQLNQTALRENTKHMVNLLADTYTCEQRDAFLKFTCTLIAGTKTALEHVIFQRPEILLNNVDDLMDGLWKYFSYDKLHHWMTNIRDKDGQTAMFYKSNPVPYVTMYNKHATDLYEPLSIRNAKGQTALHVNTVYITHILADMYTPKQRDAFLNFTSIEDENHRSALQVFIYDKLSSLIRRVENNEYAMRSYWDTNVLIIYNTDTRPRAETEAQTIFDACASKYNKYGMTLEKNRTREDTLALVRQIANKESCAGRLPSSLVVILMSHGNVGTINDCDGKPIKLSEIEEAMCSDILEGRPKMLITQCCQIGKESANAPAYTPEHDDICAVMSCVVEQKSARGVFLKRLADKIKSGRTDTNIFTIVNCVSKLMERAGHSQTPIIMSTLKAVFCPTDEWFQLIVICINI